MIEGEYKNWVDLNYDERAVVLEAFQNTEDRNESDKVAPREEDVKDYYEDNTEKFGFGSESKTPTLDKMSELQEKSQSIADFLCWLWRVKNYQLARYLTKEEYESEDNIAYLEPILGGKTKTRIHIIKEDELGPVYTNIDELFAEYFGIDLNEAEKEKRIILKDLHKRNK